MSRFFLKKQNILTNYQHLISSNNPIYNPNNYHNNHLIFNQITKIGHKHQQYAKYYSRFSNFIRKSGKDVNTPETIVYSSTVSGFSSSSTLNYVSRAFSRLGFVGWYLGMINSHPVVTKSLTCSLIYVAADLTSQTIALPSSEPYDYIRTSRMAGYGLTILGPTLHYWFNFMSKILPGRDLLTTVKKMALGQSVYGPIMTVIFFSLNAALQGEHANEIVARLKRDLFPTMLNGVMYWPLCDFITFRFAPVHLQPLVSNGFSYIWTVYMTYMASLEKASE
ncbi:hypothetical protein RND81_08G017900 [Saponaria officinalis]|uniref:PXMP2/4 family protein 4 n=1 Tax=Saponaria officinalis TaxID=3572 RepID=A0AAW1J3V0_SAPOF